MDEVKQKSFFSFVYMLIALSMFSLPTQGNAATALQDHLGRAHNAYQEALQAQSFSEREEGLNRALRLYTQLEKQPGNGKLYYNIGNTYLQMEQYGWAILYYLRAQRLLPREDRIQFHLALTRAHQGIPLDKEIPLVKKLLAVHTQLNSTERIYALFVLGVLALLAGSYVIWRCREWAKIVFAVTIVGILLVFSSLCYTAYGAPVSAVVVNAFGLYHGPDEDAALVQDEPFVPGTLVEVLDLSDEGKWLHIRTKQGTTGYIPSDVIRII